MKTGFMVSREETVIDDGDLAVEKLGWSRERDMG